MNKGLVASVGGSSPHDRTAETTDTGGRWAKTGDGHGLSSLASWLAATTAGTRGVLVPDDESVDAVDAHLARIARRLGRRLVRTDARWVDCAMRHTLLRFGADGPVRDAAEAARELRSRAHGAIVVWLGPPPSSFDRACLALLRAQPGQAQVLTVTTDQGPPGRIAEDAIVVGRDPADLAEWWAEVVQSEQREGASLTLGRAEATWQGRRPACHTNDLSDDERRALAALQLSHTGWRWRAWTEIASPRACESLLQAGRVLHHDGLVEPARTQDLAASPVEKAAIAEAMLRAMPDDPWVAMRAALLMLGIGQPEVAAKRWEAIARDPANDALRSDLFRFWLDAVARAAGTRPKVALHAAELAVELEDARAAEAFSDVLCSCFDPASFEVSWVLGRMQLLRGDARSARVSLETASHRAPSPLIRLQAIAHQAEACLLDGDLEGAHQLAGEAAACEDVSVRLLARNIQGKLILARGAADCAHSHFAQDELEARRHGLMRHRLRAAVNRAVALLAQEDADAAAPLLEQVLRQAREAGELRARTMAHLNLGVAQQLRRDPQSALEHYERTFELSRRGGDPLAAQSAARNLAELRANFGLLDEAWQTLQFVRRAALKNVVPAKRVGQALVAARILLDRGDTAAAMVEATEAIALSDRASLRRMAGDCHRLAARIALREGDVQRADQALRLAREDAPDPYAQGETALLQARLARALGDDALEAALEAKECALRGDAEELLLEANLLLAELALAAGRTTEARRHARGAAEVRDRIARRVTGSLRQAYLRRPESRHVDTVLASCDEPDPDEPPNSRARRREASAPSRRFVGEHPEITELIAKTRKVAGSDAPVLIRGESGTGKELVAELLHHASDRRDGPFVAVNCAALVETLLLSELFGHERGAFTGAVGRKRGRFELADGGTLFLDEIGDISAGAQVALLRVLQSHTFHRVGGTATLTTDVRVVCATHRELDELVARGEFRQDLYYRLCGIPLDVPPLRERGNDVVLIAQHVLEAMRSQGQSPRRQLSAGAKRVLLRHSWPGNVRELENVIRAAAILSDNPTLEEDDLVAHLQPVSVRDLRAPAPGSLESLRNEADFVRAVYQAMRYLDVPLPELKRLIEEGCIARAMDDADGQITRAARYLGMKRPRVSQLVKTYGLKSDNKDQ